MQTTTRPIGITPRISSSQQKTYAGMDKYTDIDESRQFFDSRLDANGVYILTPEQRASIAISQQQYTQGKFRAQEDMLQDVDKLYFS
ncbi:MAG: hypothetical protein FWH23_01580 [Bacteroidales bacterium]|nr:hypothetical protein [Bacteroidales bacterium]